jgi:hypothetical protein
MPAYGLKTAGQWKHSHIQALGSSALPCPPMASFLYDINQPGITAHIETREKTCKPKFKLLTD